VQPRLSERLDGLVSWEEAAQAFIKGFSESLNLELREEELTEAERERAAQLELEKYRNSGLDRTGLARVVEFWQTAYGTGVG